MQLGIIGLPGSGKSTVFRALTGGVTSGDHRGYREPDVGVVTVEDDRLDFLNHFHKAKKVTAVHVEYLDIAGLTGEGEPGRELGDTVLSHMRPLDALVHCVRFFDSPRLGSPEPLKDLERLEEEMILSDLSIVEKRLDRISSDMKRGKKELADELPFLEKAKAVLEEGKPLRTAPEVAEWEKFRGFAFLSAKPELFLVNAGDNKSRQEIDALVEEISQRVADQTHVAADWLYADAEAEIARLDPDDAREFLSDLELSEGAKNRIIKKSFELLKLIVFFTAGEKEVRAWPLSRGRTALDAAGTVHTDMQRGFIRAEVVSFQDFKDAGSTAAAHKAGKIRLEGREYEVQDGDIILFRFNV
ncbi:MAG: DUF933 domain-containing protein [Thermodesulfobacteriota bacterium]